MISARAYYYEAFPVYHGPDMRGAVNFTLSSGNLTIGSTELLYPHLFDEEQLYDLVADPNQKVNLMQNESMRAVSDSFRVEMSEYT